jgi:dUTP pyrophosphatase
MSSTTLLRPKVRRVGHSDVPLPIPRQAHEGDAGYDLCAAHHYTLFPGDQVAISTGFAWDLPKGWVGIVKDRSSRASKRTYTAAGVMDAGYRGEYRVLIRNEDCDPLEIQAGERIAQLVIVPHLSGEVELVEELGDSARSDRGFGSTGV